MRNLHITDRYHTLSDRLRDVVSVDDPFTRVQQDELDNGLMPSGRL